MPGSVQQYDVTGTFNGINQSFGLPSQPFSEVLRVFWNGQLLESHRYRLNGLTLELDFAPASGDTLRVVY